MENKLNFESISDEELQEINAGWSPLSVAWSIGKGIAVSGYKHRKDIANGWKNGWNSVK